MSSLDEIANWEIFLWARHRLGGSSHLVDVEDIFMECFAIAPARFSWRTRKNLPDYKKCAKALQQAEEKSRQPKLLIKTRNAYARQLTVEGQQWIEANAIRLSKILENELPVPEPKQRPTSRMLIDIERSEPFILWKVTKKIPKEKWKIAEVLHCSPDSNPETWDNRLQSARSVANVAERKQIIDFLDAIFSEHPDWFGG
jgi:hypothetical protein